ncbi:hypothetical protein BD413DRAFT_590324 [Trametes elegans]|nr:hypothetical protein BD413DRAFT_590297 [Trametes elegans]KAI0761335.1 hypothetical protein BD413DRAFT_590324 [Trametes elegans]
MHKPGPTTRGDHAHHAPRLPHPPVARECASVPYAHHCLRVYANTLTRQRQLTPMSIADNGDAFPVIQTRFAGFKMYRRRRRSALGMRALYITWSPGRKQPGEERREHCARRYNISLLLYSCLTLIRTHGPSSPRSHQTTVRNPRRQSCARQLPRTSSLPILARHSRGRSGQARCRTCPSCVVVHGYAINYQTGAGMTTSPVRVTSDQKCTVRTQRSAACTACIGGCSMCIRVCTSVRTRHPYALSVVWACVGRRARTLRRAWRVRTIDMCTGQRDAMIKSTWVLEHMRRASRSSPPVNKLNACIAASLDDLDIIHPSSSRIAWYNESSTPACRFGPIEVSPRPLTQELFEEVPAALERVASGIDHVYDPDSPRIQETPLPGL